jgi:hypothetical protein
VSVVPGGREDEVLRVEIPWPVLPLEVADRAAAMLREHVAHKMWYFYA